VDRGVGILGFDGNFLVFKEKFSAKLLTCKFKKMTSIFRHFVINMYIAREALRAFRGIKPQLRFYFSVNLMSRLPDCRPMICK